MEGIEIPVARFDMGPVLSFKEAKRVERGADGWWDCVVGARC